MSGFWESLAMLYLIAAVGYAAKRKGIINDSVDLAVVRLLLQITLPSLIIVSLDLPYSAELFGDFGWLLLLSCSVLGAAAWLAYLLARWRKLLPVRSGVFQGAVIFGNQGFLGLAVCLTVLPDNGVIYAAVFNIPYLLLIWTYAIYLVAGRPPQSNRKQFLLNPGIVSTAAGVLIFLLPFNLPGIIHDMLWTIGSSTTPLSMLLVGSMVANMSLKEMREYFGNKDLLIAATARLLIVPLLLIPAVVLPIRAEVLAAAVLLSAMPSAPTISLYARQYGRDERFASMTVCLTALLSLGTLPLVYYVLSIISAV
ncbi:auxin efflux carrier [Chlamydia abortus]|uniref:AEC family transporter n=1 Tax=Paenibacillus residui TaxID=629724 RepID=A0ABW3DIJ3_9BACL|nr:AEC family transporter [Paenibacillus sp. 32O-W]SHE15227.1 auxin efflux carrier [Chlamydia abortus]